MLATMRPKPFILKSLLIFGLCVCAFLAASLLVSFLLDQATVRAAATSRLSEWAGGTVEMRGPIRVSYFPDVTFEAGKIGIKGLKRLDDVTEVTADKLSAQLSWRQLLRGRIEIAELTLEKPRAVYRKRIRAAEIPTQFSNDKTNWMDILKRAPVSQLTIMSGRILFAGPENALQSGDDDISDISTTVSFTRGGGLVSGSGQFVWRQKKLAFDFKTGEPLRVAATAKMPIELNVAGSLMKASLKGELTIADGLQISGHQDIQLTDLRSIATWAGYDIPPNPAPVAFRASGTFSWIGSKLAFNDAAIAIDGNDAMGALSLNLEKSRPFIEGTLDFKEISLANYFTAPPAPGKRGNGFHKFLNLSLLEYFDADFRLSSGRVSIGKPLAGRTAVTLAIASRVLVADIAETELFGGVATGHLEIDATTSFPRLVLKGKLSRFSTANLVGSFSEVNLLKGNADLSFDLTAQGRSAEHIVSSITGKASLHVNGDGIVTVNMKRVFSAAQAERSVGWNKTLLGETGFDTLSVTFDAKNGLLHSDDFLMKTGAQTYWGGGDLVLSTNLVDWKLCLEDKTRAGQKSNGELDRQQILTLRISGPLTHPTFRFDGVVDAIDRSLWPPAPKKDKKDIPTMNASPG